MMDGFYTLGVEPELSLTLEIGDTGKVNDRGQFPTHHCLSVPALPVAVPGVFWGPLAGWGAGRQAVRGGNPPPHPVTASKPSPRAAWTRVSGWFSSGGPRLRFLTRYDGEVSEPLVGRQGSRVCMRVARGSASSPSFTKENSKAYNTEPLSKHSQHDSS